MAIKPKNSNWNPYPMVLLQFIEENEQMYYEKMEPPNQ